MLVSVQKLIILFQAIYRLNYDRKRVFFYLINLKMTILFSNYKIGCKNALLMIKNQLQTDFTKSQNKNI